MSTDANNVEYLSWFLQELWAKMLEVLIGMAMLWNQLGWWCLTPLVIIAGKCQLNARNNGVQCF
jgi:ATP-binding cassette subfamily C (CFTR/MRP) protein 1